MMILIRIVAMDDCIQRLRKDDLEEQRTKTATFNSFRQVFHLIIYRVTLEKSQSPCGGSLLTNNNLKLLLAKSER